MRLLRSQRLMRSPFRPAPRAAIEGVGGERREGSRAAAAAVAGGWRAGSVAVLAVVKRLQGGGGVADRSICGGIDGEGGGGGTLKRTPVTRLLRPKSLLHKEWSDMRRVKVLPRLPLLRPVGGGGVLCVCWGGGGGLWDPPRCVPNMAICPSGNSIFS